MQHYFLLFFTLMGRKINNPSLPKKGSRNIQTGNEKEISNKKKLKKGKGPINEKDNLATIAELVEALFKGIKKVKYGNVSVDLVLPGLVNSLVNSNTKPQSLIYQN